MIIYPYVYRLTHPSTGQYYIGVRCANKLPAEQDLGIKYFTSSKFVKPRFHEFEYSVIAIFFTKQAAYEFEQELISETFKDKKSLNKCANSKGGLSFSNKGHTIETKEKLRQIKTGCKTVFSLKICRLFDKKEISMGEFIRWCYNQDTNTITHTKETKLKMSKVKKGKPSTKAVCRLIDKKEMNLGNYTFWLKGGHSNKSKEKLKKYSSQKHVCRLSDKKEMNKGNYHIWLKSQPQTDDFQR